MPKRVESVYDEKFGHVVRILLTLLEMEDKPPTVSELKIRSRVAGTAFFSHLKDNLQRAGWVEFRVNPDRTITAHLTPTGKKVAKALKSIEKELKEAGIV
jgi:DNA-binding MarR family transcriptional regulator